MLSPEFRHGDDGYIFISHAPQDSARITPIVTRMQRDGFRVWRNDGTYTDADADDKIAARISACGYFIAFLSANYLASDECKDELMYARDLGRQQLLIYLEDMELPSGMAMRMGRNQAIFHNRYRSSEDFYAKVYEAQNISTFSPGVSLPAPEETRQTATTLQRRRRSAYFWGLGVVLVIAMAAACIFFFSQKAPAEDTGSAASGNTAETSTAPTIAPVDEDLLLDNEHLAVRFLSLDSDSNGAALSLSIENKADSGVYLTVDECYVNGVRCITDFLAYVPGGQNGRAEILIEAEELAVHGIELSGITVIDCVLLNKEPGNSDASELGRITYYPTGKENAQFISYEPSEEDTIIADTSEYLIAYRKRYYNEAMDAWYLPVILVNRTEEDMVFTAENETVNRLAQDSGWSQVVGSHRIVQTTISFSAIQWKPAGYEQVLAYTGAFCAYAGSTAHGTPVFSQRFAIYPEGEKEGAQLEPRTLKKNQLIYEDESFRFGYLGVWEDSSGGLEDLFYIHNLTDSQQILDFLMQMDDQNSTEYSDTPVLAPGGELILSCSRNNSATSATVTLECWLQEYFRYETFGPFTVSLADK